MLLCGYCARSLCPSSPLIQLNSNVLVPAHNRRDTGHPERLNALGGGYATSQVQMFTAFRFTRRTRLMFEGKDLLPDNVTIWVNAVLFHVEGDKVVTRTTAAIDLA